MKVCFGFAISELNERSGKRREQGCPTLGCSTVIQNYISQSSKGIYDSDYAIWQVELPSPDTSRLTFWDGSFGEPVPR
jgi:hypothetical protein